MFELLSSPHLGTLGPELQEETMRRMMSRYGYRLGEQETLSQAAASLLRPAGAEGIVPSLWTEEMSQLGGKLNIPGIGDVTIPAAEELSQLASYKTTAGVEVTPALAKEYEQLLGDAQLFEAGKITREEMLRSMNTARQQVQRSAMLTMTGTDSLLRGRLEGSRFLTSVPTTHVAEMGLARDEVGITYKYARRMLKEVGELHGDKALMNEYLARLRSGEAIGGAVMRHPFIGPHSTAPIRVRLIPGDEPIAVFGEKFMEAGLLPEDHTGRIMGKRLADVPGIERLGAMRLGPGVGLAMDFDADIVNLMLLPRGLEDKAMKAALTEEADAYAIRSQLLKAKKAGTKNLAQMEAAADAALKLRIPKEKLGLISESLQIARASVLSNTNKIETKRVMNALGFLEWLEQTPISGKHIPAGQSRDMITLFSNIRQSVNTRSKEKLIQNALSVVQRGGIGEKFLRQGGRVALEGRAGGLRVLDVPGINIEQAAEDIMTGMGIFEREGVGGISPARLRQIIRGRTAQRPITGAEAEALFSYGFKGQTPFAGLIQTIDSPGALTSMTRKVSGLRNRVASFGGRVLEHAKPIALGFGAAVGIATILSGPPKTLTMDAPPPMIKGRGRGGEDITPQDLTDPAAHRQLRGSPTVDPPIEGVNTAPVMPNSVSVSVRGKSRGAVDFNMLNSHIARSLGGAQVSSRVVDNRQSLNAQNIAKILKDGQ
jgi:hypothetical protein